MAPTGPRLCCCLLACLLLLGCFPASISAEVSATSSIEARSSASAAEQNRPSFLAAVLGGDARKKADSEEGLEESASLKSIFGLGPKDLPDADSVDPTLVAIGMDSSSSSSSVGTAAMDTRRSSKHSHHSGSADTSYDSSSSSSKQGFTSSAEEEALLQAFDAEEEEQLRQHHKQHQHRQKGLGWVLGRRSAKGAAKDKDSSGGHHKDKDKDISKEGTAAGSSSVNAGAAFVEKRIKPLLAAIKSKAPNLGRGKNRRYTRAEVEEIVRIMSAEAKQHHQQQQGGAGASSSSSGSDGLEPAGSSSDGSNDDGAMSMLAANSDTAPAITGADSSSSSLYDQQADSGNTADDEAYAELKFKELVRELRHHKKAAALSGASPSTAADGLSNDGTAAHPHGHSHAHLHGHKPHSKHAAAATAAADEEYTTLSTDSSSDGTAAYSDGGAAAEADPVSSSVYSGIIFHELKKDGSKPDTHKSASAAAHSEAKKQLQKARRAAAHVSHQTGGLPAAGSSSVGADGSGPAPAALKTQRHKKAHMQGQANPAAPAKRAHIHKASHAKRAEFLDSSEMEDIKTILEAIYDKENSVAASVTGEEAATLAEIQAALQPHIITDDPASFSLGAFGSAEDSIPSEQTAAAAAAAAAAQQGPVPVPAELPAAPTPAAAAPAADSKTAPAAPAAKKAAAPARGAPAATKKAEAPPAPAAAHTEDAETEVVYEIEYVEEEEAATDEEASTAADSDVEEIEYEVDVDTKSTPKADEGNESSEDDDDEEEEKEEEEEGAEPKTQDKPEDTSRKFRSSGRSTDTPSPTPSTKTASKGEVEADGKKGSSPKGAASSSKGAKGAAPTQGDTHRADSEAKSKAKAKASQKPASGDKGSSQGSGQEGTKGRGEGGKDPAAVTDSKSRSDSTTSSSSSSSKADKPAAGASKSDKRKSDGSKARSDEAEEEEEEEEKEEQSTKTGSTTKKQAAAVKTATTTSPAQRPTVAAQLAPAAKAPSKSKGEEGEEEEEADEGEEEEDEEAAEVEDIKPPPPLLNCTSASGILIEHCAVCMPPPKGGQQTCQTCHPGYYRETPTKCTLCPKGAYCGGSAMVRCKEGLTTAETGRWAANQCTLCAAGYGASSAPGSALSCQKCAAGSFTPRDAILPCQHCQSSTMSIDLVTTGLFGAGGTACLACPSGLVPDDSSGGCRCPASSQACACPKGWASTAGNGGPPCMKCGASNTYAAVKKDTGIKACVACPRDSLATDGTDCKCRPGTFSRDGTPFVEGGCQACPADAAAAEGGSTACLKCGPHTVPNTERTACVQQQQQQQQQRRRHH